MSTNSCVIVKLRREDIGKEMKFDASKLPSNVSLESWDGEEVKEMCEPIQLNGEYVGIYCHWDGYPSGVGAALEASFKSYDDVLNLILGGACSSINDDSIRHYSNRNGEEWKHIKPCVGNHAYEVVSKVGGYIEYSYLFDNDKWNIL